jgi:hypothetical protein
VVAETLGRRKLGEEELMGEGEPQHQDTNEKISSEIPQSEDSDRSHEANDDDEDDEDPQPTDNALTPLDEPTLVDNGHHYASRTSRSPSITVESAPVAEYQEWPFQGFLKRIRIRDDVTYNLEFKLPSISEHLHLLIGLKALDTNHNAATHSQIHQAPL